MFFNGDGLIQALLILFALIAVTVGVIAVLIEWLFRRYYLELRGKSIGRTILVFSSVFILAAIWAGIFIL